ncbi:unnamed protein product, partial [Protopolystoma xenopodis]
LFCYFGYGICHSQQSIPSDPGPPPSASTSVSSPIQSNSNKPEAKFTSNSKELRQWLRTTRARMAAEAKARAKCQCHPRPLVTFSQIGNRLDMLYQPESLRQIGPFSLQGTWPQVSGDHNAKTDVKLDSSIN